jgi:hypothetical protein
MHLESAVVASAGRLLGRHTEHERVRALLGHARNGRGGALLVTGEPDIGRAVTIEARCAAGHLVTSDEVAVTAAGPFGP